MEPQFKLTAMHALLHFIEAERILRPIASKFEKDHPELFKKHVDGVRAELNQKDWSARRENRTLSPLLKVLAPHKGLNVGLGLLPYYAAQYRQLVDLRNAIGHGDWEKLEKLGGSDKALEWARCFYGLVDCCTRKGDPQTEMMAMGARAALQLGSQEWPWPAK